MAQVQHNESKRNLAGNKGTTSPELSRVLARAESGSLFAQIIEISPAGSKLCAGMA